MQFLKVFLWIFFAILLLIVVGVYWGKTWINNNLEAVVNADPDRQYNVNFKQLEVDFFRGAILINEVKITPLGEKIGVIVEGDVVQVMMTRVNILKLIWNKVLDVQELSFSQPEFIIHIPLENPDEKKPAVALQSLFGDLLSRGAIRNFQLDRASAVMLLGEDQIGSLNNLNILATELATDSLKWNYPIPFDYKRILISIDSLDYLMDNQQSLKVGKIEFDTESQQLILNTISLKYSDGLQKASLETDFQVDLIEVELEALILSGIEANSNLYSNLDIRARKMELQGLEFEDFRNKNIARPPDEMKPLFQGLINKINFPLKLDTLKLTNATIVYGEMVPGKNENWQLHIDNLNGDLINLTSIPESQAALGHIRGKFTAKIQGSGNLTIDLKVPYDRDEFDMGVDFTSFNLTKINELLKPIMNGEIVSGDLVRMNVQIHGNSRESSNQLRFDYTDLKIELYQKGTEKKNRVLSSLANLAVNNSNLPGERKYQTATYTTQRNQYRGPIHLVWKSTKEGILTIVPGGVAQEFLKSSEK
ncbi:DUF748 domain-containing protein [Algoriphagus sp.]|uniref:DUF748 domain-containing protein n=1 Tax=Algoriphagus sp. TaxID=1872435 RepID=UPI003919CF78